MACVRSLHWVIISLATLLAACGGDQASPEQRIRDLIDAVEAHVEAGELRALDQYLHADYSDQRHRTKLNALGTLFALLRRHRSVHLFTLVNAVEFDAGAEGRANAVVYVAMTGVPVASMETLISLKADLYRFDIELQEADGQWQVLASRWDRVDPRSL